MMHYGRQREAANNIRYIKAMVVGSGLRLVQGRSGLRALRNCGAAAADVRNRASHPWRPQQKEWLNTGGGGNSIEPHGADVLCCARCSPDCEESEKAPSLRQH
jgi:hypothetical protein